MNLPEDFAAVESRFLAKAAPSIAARTLETNGPARRVHALEGGRGENVLLLHGGGGFAAAWAPILEPLAARCHALAVDRPGCGLTDRVDYRCIADYRAHAVAFVESVLDAARWTRASIVANSMGGYWASEFALARPDRVDKLVLVGAPAGADRSLPFPLRLLSVRGLNGLVQRSAESPAGVRRTFAGALVAHPERVGDDLVELSRLTFTMPGGRLAWLSMLERFAGLGGVKRAWLNRERMLAIRAPTTFVWGARDAFAPPSSGHDLARRMPRARCVEVPDAGHLPWLDDPDAVARALREALG